MLNGANYPEKNKQYDKEQTKRNFPFHKQHVDASLIIDSIFYDYVSFIVNIYFMIIVTFVNISSTLRKTCSSLPMQSSSTRFSRKFSVRVTPLPVFFLFR